MLVQLTPDQIAEGWSLYEERLSLSVPNPSGRKMNLILRSLLDGTSQLWIHGNEGIVLTTFHVDPITHERNLLIYALVKLEGVSMESWGAGLEDLRVFARNNGCSYIIAYTVQDKVVSLARRLGADSIWRLISVRV